MGCGAFLVKYILFFANLFFALSGLALLGLGIAVQLQITAVTNLVDTSFQGAPIASMVVGSVVFLIAFFGCCGAIKENSCMLITYSIFMLILMILKITLASLLFVNRNSLVDGVTNLLIDAFDRDRVGFQEIEREFQCCGPTGPSAYLNVALPATCCASQPCTIINAYSGCDKLLQELVETYTLVIGAVAIVVVAVELVSVVFGFCLANHARNKSRSAHY